MNSNTLLSNLAKNASDKDFTFNRLYRLLYNKNLYYTALGNIYKNRGSGTSGVDGETIDGFKESKIDRIIEELRTEKYQPSPLKRIDHSKQKDGNRSIGIPTFEDRLVQEVIRMILEVIYEPIFSGYSHGFRKGKSCHTAIKQVEKYFTGSTWWIKADIKGCFENIDHNKLIQILGNRIKDERFLRLIRKFLKSGICTSWKYDKTYSGCPQGSIIGPILSNIYLNELDSFIENELKPEFDLGKAHNRKYNTVYLKYRNRVQRRREKINKEQDPEKRKQLIKDCKKNQNKMLSVPAQAPFNKNFKRIQYCRYADDWICGVIGSKEDAQNILDRISSFLKEELKLELSPKKTHITKSNKKVRFLGFDLLVRTSSTIKNTNNGKKRPFNKKVEVLMPSDVVRKFLLKEEIVEDIDDIPWKPKSRAKLLHLSDIEILQTVNSELRGLYNYYCLAENVYKQMSNLAYPMEYSCLKTLANKHKSSVSKLKSKYQKGKNWGITYQTKAGSQTTYFYKDFKRNRTPNTLANIDVKFNKEVYRTNTTELETRLRAEKCEICGRTGPVEIHHVNKLKNLKGKKEWERIMIAKRRKTMVLCPKCHDDLHAGRLD